MYYCKIGPKFVGHFIDYFLMLGDSSPNISKSFSQSYLVNDVYFKASNEAFVMLFLWSWLQVFLKVVWCTMCKFKRFCNKSIFFYGAIFYKFVSFIFVNVGMGFDFIKCGGLCLAFWAFLPWMLIFFSGWLLCIIGCFGCVLSTYRQLRQLVNMYAGSFEYLIVISLSEHFRYCN